MLKKILLLVLAVVTICTMILGYIYVKKSQPQIDGTSLNNSVYVGDIVLNSSQLGEVKLSYWQDKTTLIFFGFTRCPDVCPTTMHRLSKVYADLPNAAEDVQVILITVDPQHDTPEIIQRYVEGFSPEFVGLSGTAKAIADAARAFYVGYQETGDADIFIHTDIVAILDKNSHLRYIYSQDKMRYLAADLSLILKKRDF